MRFFLGCLSLSILACAAGGVEEPVDTSTSGCVAVSEQCNGLDDDCDGEVDENVANLPEWFADDDGDTYGDAEESLQECTAPAGFVGTAGDCNDEDVAINPAAIELGNNDVDENCDGEVDATCGPNAPVVVLDRGSFDPDYQFFDDSGPGLLVETTVNDIDGDLWFITTELWIDTSADGVVDTSEDAMFEYTPFNDDPDDTCSDDEVLMSYAVQADEYVDLGAVDVAVRSADSQGHWSETVVTTIEW